MDRSLRHTFLTAFGQTTDYGRWYDTNYCQSWLSYRTHRWWPLQCPVKDPDGVGITPNSLHINPKQFSFQFPLWRKLRCEGLPVEGFCVTTGIPSTEDAVETIGGLCSAAIKHVSFKPGSVEGILQVVSLAVANPDFPIVLQWTGGCTGRHDSYEDFHNPILRTYTSIRQYDNICLVGGLVLVERMTSSLT